MTDYNSSYYLFIGVLALIITGVSFVSAYTSEYEVGSSISVVNDSNSINNSVVDNGYKVNLPEGSMRNKEISLFDGSARFFFNKREVSKSYNCSLGPNETDGCISFEPKKTYQECNITYHKTNMSEYCKVTNDQGSVTFRADDRFNDITAPITSEKLNVEKLANVSEEVENPWDIMFLNDDRYLVTEMYGGILDVKEDGSIVTYNIDVRKNGTLTEYNDDHYVGLMGAAKDPNFSENNIIYLYYSYDSVKSEDHILNKVSKFRINRSEGEIEKLDTVVEGIPGYWYHQGGRLRFGPRNKYLYITTGAAEQSKVQNNSYLGGKVLRLYPNGSIPDSNPYGTEIFAKGLRNPQGLDFNPETGVAVASAHGPYRRDSIAKVGNASNLGWPDPCKRSHHDAKVGEEILCTQTWTLAPSGITFVDEKSHPWYNDLFISGLRGKHVHRINLEGGNPTANEIFWFNGFQSEAYHESANELRDVEYADGYLFVLHQSGYITKISPEYGLADNIYNFINKIFFN